MTDHKSKPGLARRSTYLVVVVLALLSVCCRLFPIPGLPNFGAMGALALFAGSRLPVWQTLLLVGTLQVSTDLYFLLVKGWALNPFVYCSYPAYMVLGWWTSHWQKTRSLAENGARQPLASLISSTYFVLISDFGTWLLHPGSEEAFYPQTLWGLLLCYQSGFLFSLWTYISDFFFSGGSFLLEAKLSAELDHEAEKDYLADSEEEGEGAEPTAVPEPQPVGVTEG